MFPIRDENPTHKKPIIVIFFIILNSLAFLYEVSLGSFLPHFLNQWAIVPRYFLEADFSIYKTLITSIFLHGSVMHLLSNMWFLWIFGDNIEDLLGHIGFIFFYFVTGISAGLVHILLNRYSEIPTLGASGAISGVLGAYLILFPKIRIKTLIALGFFWDFVHVPAVFFLGLWFILQAIGGLGPNQGIAFAAHIGGFVSGVLLTYLFTKPNPISGGTRYLPKRIPRI